jgi:hypothetical protein
MDYNFIITTLTDHPFFCIIFTSTVLFFACVIVRGWPTSSSSNEDSGEEDD